MHVSDFIVHDNQYMLFCVQMFFDQNVTTFSFSETACFAIDVINPYNFSAPSGT